MPGALVNSGPNVLDEVRIGAELLVDEAAWSRT